MKGYKRLSWQMLKCERSEYNTFHDVSQLRLISVTRKHFAYMPRNNSDQLAYYSSCYGDRPCYGLKEKLLDIDEKKDPPKHPLFQINNSLSRQKHVSD